MDVLVCRIERSRLFRNILPFFAGCSDYMWAYSLHCILRWMVSPWDGGCSPHKFMNSALGCNKNLGWRRFVLAVSTLLVSWVALSAAQDKAFQLDPAQTSVKFTLGDVLHTVRGTFRLKHGSLDFEP